MKAKKPITPQEAQAKLEALCVRAEHSTGELYERLRRWGVGGTDAQKIMASLKAHRFVDDNRFARAYTTDKVKFARWGRRKIQQGLMMKKVPADIIKEVLSEIDEELYSTILEKLIRAKIATDEQLLETYEGRSKLFRFAASRGYEPQLCATVLRGIIERSKEEL